MERKRRADETVRAALKDVRYEFEMLVETLRARESGGNMTSFLKDALLESFLIHFRSLYYFLYRRAKKEDVVAGDYFLTPERWEGVSPVESGSLGEEEDRASKLLAHITYTRSQAGDQYRGWRVRRMAKHIVEGMAKFVQQARPELLGEEGRRIERLVRDFRREPEKGSIFDLPEDRTD